MLTIVIAIVCGVGFCIVAAVLWFALQRFGTRSGALERELLVWRADSARTQSESLQVLQSQMHETLKLTHEQLADTRRLVMESVTQLSGTVGEQLGNHEKVIREVKGQLGGLMQTAQNIQELSKDISSLQNILRAPKLRGNLGELFLEEMLRQVLPEAAYELQYRFGTAAGHVIVDAVIRLGDRLVPIDSKFPLESFQRWLADDVEQKSRKAFVATVKQHIDAVAEKYIRPELGTYDFALMYLPAENLYYEAVIRDDSAVDIVAYAASRKVIPVSPNTFYAYLLTVAYGLKGMQIERQAETIRGQIATFQKRFGDFYKSFEKIGRNVDLAYRNYDEAERQARKLNDHVGTITGHAGELTEEANVASLGS